MIDKGAATLASDEGLVDIIDIGQANFWIS
jgi:hypothetical protein